MTEVFNNENKGKPSFTFVVATQMSEDDWRNGKKELPLLQSLSKMTLDEVDVRVFVFFSNVSGLSSCYNRAIDEIRRVEIEIPKFIVFVHDDITLNDCFFFDKVINSKFDVIGAVGGCYWGIPSGFPIDAKPLIWTTATCGKGASGFMNHDLKNGYFLPSSYGVAPQQTATLDGSIIIFTRKAIESGLRWDEQFNFHWYDMDICFSAHRLGLKVGTANLLLTHESVGGSVVQPEFLDSQRKFISKWKLLTTC